MDQPPSSAAFLRCFRLLLFAGLEKRPPLLSQRPNDFCASPARIFPALYFSSISASIVYTLLFYSQCFLSPSCSLSSRLRPPRTTPSPRASTPSRSNWAPDVRVRPQSQWKHCILTDQRPGALPNGAPVPRSAVEPPMKTPASRYDPDQTQRPVDRGQEAYN